MPQIRIKTGPNKGKVIRLQDNSLKIGRDSTCDIQLLESGVSREHAEVYRVGEMFFIRDLGSRNGSVVNKRRIEDELLRDGDVIRISGCALVFEGTNPAFGEGDSQFHLEEESFYREENDPATTLTLLAGPTRLSAPISQKSHLVMGRLKKLAAEPTDPQSLFDEILAVVAQYLEVQEAFIFILETNGKLVEKAYRAEDGLESKSKASRTIVLRALKEKRHIMSANAREYFRFKSEASIIIKRVNSVFCVPLVALGRDLGVIYLSNAPTKAPFNEEHGELMELIASQTALIYQAVRSTLQSRDAHNQAIKQLETTVENLYPVLRGRGDRVSRMVRFVGEMMELKGRPIFAMQTAARLHHLGYLGMSKQIDGLSREFLENDRDYAEKSAELIGEQMSYPEVLDIIRYHRCRLDGKGKPEIEGAKWDILSQILAICVEADLRLNLPLAFNIEEDSVSVIISNLVTDAGNVVCEKVLTAFQQAHANGLILSD